MPNSRWIDFWLDPIESQYNPEHDSGANIGAPPVTFAEYRLMRAVRVLADRVAELEKKIKEQN